MAWGEAGKTRKLLIEDGSQTWGVGGTPNNYRLQPSGILDNLRLITVGTSTFTANGGTGAVDVTGPHSYYTNVQLSPSQQAPIYQTTGYGNLLVQCATSIEGNPVLPGLPVMTVPNTSTVLTYAYQVTATSASQVFSHKIPVGQTLKSIGAKVGMWPLNNPLVQMVASWTPNTVTASSPYTLGSTTALTSPILLTGSATFTIATPTVYVVKHGWDVPQSDNDLPPFNYASSWIEEAFQTSPNGATKITWTNTPLSGLLVRLGFYILEATAGTTPANLTSPTAIQLNTGQLQPKVQEGSYDASIRQELYYGFDLPQGMYIYDFLGYDLTLQDTLNTQELPNIQLIVTTSSAFNSASVAKVVKQLIAPIVPMY